MQIKIRDIYSYIDGIAPYDNQMEWDNSGLMTGSMDDAVSSVMLSLDCTNSVIDQAADMGCGLIINHHPLIFHPAKSVDRGTPLYNAVRKNISVLCAHTNLDAADDGVNTVLCRILGIENRSPLFAEGKSILRMGEVTETSAAEFAEFVADKLNNSVKYFDGGRPVKKVAVCGGAGGEYTPLVFEAGCDTFVTGEAHHHEFLLAENLGLNLISAGHYATENPVISFLKDKLEENFPNLKVYIAETENPYKTII
ncbi:MAG: Nif3-like dinuclear metal center hexameric protein [Clostridiales bacterium]|nr:Nif3-like dinuclear metal center hexameric protein [Clostridiales bacterium]